MKYEQMDFNWLTVAKEVERILNAKSKEYVGYSLHNDCVLYAFVTQTRKMDKDNTIILGAISNRIRVDISELSNGKPKEIAKKVLIEYTSRI